MFCWSMENTNVRLNYFLSNKQIFYINMLGSQRASSVLRERNSCRIITKYLQRIRNGIHDNQPWDKIPQPSYSLACRLVISYILCLHSFKSCKRLFDTFHKTAPPAIIKVYPEVDLLLSEQSIKFSLEYPTASRISNHRYVSIKSLVPFKYLSLFFASVQWLKPGSLKYLPSTPIA
jgi:hypothetical protein